tara:strand:+ start:8392 stop:9009 length:618 start_codon:yes stop_codon:yes gene_type:complete
MKKIAENSKNFYNNCLLKFGNTPKGLNWKNKSSQLLRFEIFSNIGQIDNHSIHDFGCGFGDFYTYLKKNFKNFDYVGTDISSKMISIAKRKNIKNRFFIYDLINSQFRSELVKDYVVSSGVFTVKNNVKNKDWLKYVIEGAIKMFRYSKKGIGFNLMTSEVDFKDKNLFYMDPVILFKILEKNLSSKIKIINSYNLWEYTVFIYR